MEQKRRFLFFCPTVHKSTEAQTDGIIKQKPCEGSINDRIRRTTLQSLLYQPPPESRFERTITSDFNSRFPILLNSCNDPKFDILTPPPDLLKSYPVALYIELLDTEFIFFNASKTENVSFPYTHEFKQILTCFELKSVSYQMLGILDHLKVTEWENGAIVAEISDFRYEHPHIFKMRLVLSEEAKLQYLKQEFSSLKEEDRIRLEQEILTLANPSICTDPSPDVARVQSSLDMKQKMWLDHKDRLNQEVARGVTIEDPQVDNHVVHTFTERISTLEIPPDLSALFATVNYK